MRGGTEESCARSLELGFFLYYADNLRVYVQSCRLEGLCGKSDVAVALRAVPVVSIPPGVKWASGRYGHYVYSKNFY